MASDEEIARLRADVADLMAAIVKLAIKTDINPEDVPLDIWELYRGAKIANDLMNQIEGNKLDFDFKEMIEEITGPESGLLGVRNDPNAWRVGVAHYRSERYRRR